MQRFIITVNSNKSNHRLDQWVEFTKFRIKKLIYKPLSSSYGVLTLKINNLISLYHIDSTYGTIGCTFTAPYIPDNTLVYSNSDSSYDYEQTWLESRHSIDVVVFEDNTEVTNAHLATNPLIFEIEFER